MERPLIKNLSKSANSIPDRKYRNKDNVNMNEDEDSSSVSVSSNSSPITGNNNNNNSNHGIRKLTAKLRADTFSSFDDNSSSERGYRISPATLRRKKNEIMNKSKLIEAVKGKGAQWKKKFQEPISPINEEEDEDDEDREEDRGKGKELSLNKNGKGGYKGEDIELDEITKVKKKNKNKQGINSKPRRKQRRRVKWNDEHGGHLVTHVVYVDKYIVPETPALAEIMKVLVIAGVLFGVAVGVLFVILLLFYLSIVWG